MVNFVVFFRSEWIVGIGTMTCKGQLSNSGVSDLIVRPINLFCQHRSVQTDP